MSNKIFIHLTEHFKEQCAKRGNLSISYYVRKFRGELKELKYDPKKYKKQRNGRYTIEWMKYKYIFEISNNLYTLLTFIDFTKNDR